MNVTPLMQGKATATSSGVDSETIVKQSRANEVFFAVVGPVGAGSSRAISALKRALEAGGYTPSAIKASDRIREWAKAREIQLPDPENKTLSGVSRMQDLGDQMRENDKSAVARAIIQEIAKTRASAMGKSYTPGEVIEPDAVKRAYLIDSIRHPAEIQLLRRTYGHAFAVVGVVCQESERERRVLEKYFTGPQRLQEANKKAAGDFIKRDSDDPDKKHGQHVGDAFHQADYFIDNTRSDPEDVEGYLNEAPGALDQHRHTPGIGAADD